VTDGGKSGGGGGGGPGGPGVGVGVITGYGPGLNVQVMGGLEKSVSIGGVWVNVMGGRRILLVNQMSDASSSSWTTFHTSISVRGTAGGVMVTVVTEAATVVNSTSSTPGYSVDQRTSKRTVVGLGMIVVGESSCHGGKTNVHGYTLHWTTGFAWSYISGLT
jgi:hypothetical protein